jgi:anaerobic ribonucleoside-triphosphate reductase
MCDLDHICFCPEEVTSGVFYCKKCGQPICPCGSHDVVQISRVTGYLSDVEGWNNAKKAELKDRNRYNIANY